MATSSLFFDEISLRQITHKKILRRINIFLNIEVVALLTPYASSAQIKYVYQRFSTY